MCIEKPSNLDYVNDRDGYAGRLRSNLASADTKRPNCWSSSRQ
jgi:hypothetical protein